MVLIPIDHYLWNNTTLSNNEDIDIWNGKIIEIG